MQGHVAGVVGADDGAGHGLGLRARALEDDLDRLDRLAVVADHVGVGEDVAVVRDDEAGPERLLRLLRAEELLVGAAGERGDDLDDALCVLLVDLARGEALPLAEATGVVVDDEVVDRRRTRLYDGRLRASSRGRRRRPSARPAAGP